MKISTQKAIGWVLLCLGLGGAVLFLWAIGLFWNDSPELQKDLVKWSIISGVMAIGGLVLLVWCYRRESLQGNRTLHLSLMDLIIASVFVASIMGIGDLYLNERGFLLFALPIALVSLIALLMGLLLAGKKSLHGRWRYVFGFGFVPLVSGVLGLGAVAILAAFVVYRKGPAQLSELPGAVLLLKGLSPDEYTLLAPLRVALICLPVGLLVCWLAWRGRDVKRE